MDDEDGRWEVPIGGGGGVNHRPFDVPPPMMMESMPKHPRSPPDVQIGMPMLANTDDDETFQQR